MPDILKKFSSHLVNSLKKGEFLALENTNKLITPTKLLQALGQEKGSVAFEVLHRNAPNLFSAKIIPRTLPPSAVLPKNFSPQSKQALKKAALLAAQKNHYYIGTEHLLSTLLETEDQELQGYLKENNINTDLLKKQTLNILKNTSKLPDLTKFFAKQKAQTGILEPNSRAALDFFARDLTDREVQKNIDPVIGREEEISRLIQILMRRTKNNPLLLGDSGVGKTAIVEGLAKRIIEGKVPGWLLGKKILSLDLGLLVAGTMFRGEFENRLKTLLEEVQGNDNYILFIDELHNIMGAGSANGSLDAANLLKPALSRGELRCIGATTLDEYRKHIEKDAALDRRFQPIMVNEPSPEKTIEILQGIKKNYQNFHSVEITQEATQAAVELSDRYLTDRFLPDKAIDLIDEAASQIKFKQKESTEQKKHRELKQEIAKIRINKKEAVDKEDFTKAIKFKNEEAALQPKLNQLREQIVKNEQQVIGQIVKEDIAQVIAKITGIPATSIAQDEKRKLLDLEEEINKKIIGQAEAVQNVTQFIKRSRTGLSPLNRPIASFLFAGSTGVGKTELTRVLAQTVYESRENLVKIDMSEFSEKFNVSKLIGSPPGYVGFQETGKLTESVRRRPYSVVLFDEIEKAHPDVFNILLQILDEGCLTDAAGKKINFKNTIVILTSNLGGREINFEGINGFDLKEESDTLSNEEIKNIYSEIKDKIIKETKKFFSPELLNRLDKIIVFKPLGSDSLVEIIKKQMTELNERLASQDLKLEFDDKIIKHLFGKINSWQEGARSIQRIVQEEIENSLADELLKDNIKSGTSVNIIIQDKKVAFKLKN